MVGALGTKMTGKALLYGDTHPPRYIRRILLMATELKALGQWKSAININKLIAALGSINQPAGKRGERIASLNSHSTTSLPVLSGRDVRESFAADPNATPDLANRSKEAVVIASLPA